MKAFDVSLHRPPPRCGVARVGGVDDRTGSPLFGTGFIGAGLSLGWRFFVTYDPHRGEDP